jgi:TRAP transporter TAXI family solute receptor
MLRLLYIFILTTSLYATEFVTIGTGSLTGIYYPTGGAICNMVNKKKSITGIRCAKEATGGSVYNINALRVNEIDFGIVQSDIVYQAYNGQGKFKNRANRDLRVVMSIYPELLTLVVRKDSNIKNLIDIVGKKINIGNYGSGQRATVEELLKISENLSKSSLQEVCSMDAKDAKKAMKQSKLDGYFYVVGHPTSSIKEIAQNVDIDLIDITNSSCDSLDTLLKKHPYYSIGKIRANTYKGIDRDVTTFGVKALLVTSKDTDNKIVEVITHAILDNFELFKSLNPAYDSITKESLLDTLSIPQHEAAKRVFDTLKVTAAKHH